jgi:hypothetical protein
MNIYYGVPSPTMEVTVRNIHGVVVAVLLGTGCTKPSANIQFTETQVPPSVIQVARPGSPWPTSAVPCTIESSLDEGREFDIFRSHASTSANTAPVARVARPWNAQLRWTGLPIFGQAAVAQLAATAEGIVINGWASLVGRPFVVNDEIPIIDDHLWVPVGGEASILGTSGAQIALGIATSFAAPANIELLVPCSSFGAKANPKPYRPRDEGPPYASPTGRNVSIRAAPGRPILFTFAPRGASWSWLGQDGGFVHIAGEYPSFDGWVAAAEVQREETRDRDSRGGMDEYDHCYSAVTVRDAPLFVGTPDTIDTQHPIGVVLLDTGLDLGKRRGSLVEFTTTNLIIVPPTAQQFMVRFDDIRQASEKECW